MKSLFRLRDEESPLAERLDGPFSRFKESSSTRTILNQPIPIVHQIGIQRATLSVSGTLVSLAGLSSVTLRRRTANKLPANRRGYASNRSGFSSFQTSVLSPLAIFSMLSIETFRSHRSTELT